MIQEEEDQTAKGVQEEEEGEVDPNSNSNDIDELSVVIQQECRICKDFVSPVADITLGCNCETLLIECKNVIHTFDKNFKIVRTNLSNLSVLFFILMFRSFKVFFAFIYQVFCMLTV